MTDEESRKAIVRYDLAPALYTCGDYFSVMESAADGEYVLYKEHVAAVARATKRERERCLDWVHAFRTMDDKSSQVIALIESGR